MTWDDSCGIWKKREWRLGGSTACRAGNDMVRYEVIIHISLCCSRLDALWILLAVIYVSFEVCDRCFMILPVVFGICGFSVMSTWLIRVVTC